MIFKNIRESLRVKLILGSVIIEIIMLCLLLSNSVRLINEATLNHAKTHLEEIPPLLNSALAPLLFQRDYAAINDFLNDMIIDDLHGISYIVIFDESGQIYGTKGNIDASNLPQRNDVLQDKIQSEFIHSEIALQISNKQIGTVKFGISLAHLIESKDKLLQQGILIAAAEIVLTALLLGLLGFMLTRHIVELVKSANKMSGGDYEIRMEESGKDEIGQLSTSFNKMAAAIRKQIKNLKASEEKYYSLFATVSDAIMVFDGKTRDFIDMNDAVTDIYGYTREEFMQLNHSDITVEPEKSAESIIQTLRGQSLHIPLRYHKHKNGTVFPVEITSGSFELENRQLVFGIVKDISNRVQVEKALKESEERLNLALESVNDALWDWKLDTGDVHFNPGWFTMLGYDPGELPQEYETWNSLLHPDDKPYTEQVINNHLKSKKPFKMEFRMRAKDGAWKWVLGRGKVVESDANGKPIRMIGTNVDISDRKQLEEKLQQAQKMESIGNLAGGIAHDFNNILFPIVGMSELLLEDLPEGSIEHENAQEILIAGKRGSDLVKQILAFSRQTEHKFVPTRIQQVLKDALKLCRASIPTDIAIDENIQRDCGLVMADPTQLHQVAMNLITNAYHAIDVNGGEIKVELEEVYIRDKEFLGSSLQPGKYVQLTVSDTGKGIDDALVGKIFEPYFTTKVKGKGTGLGLAVVHGIVKEHGGDIIVHSELGKGSQFSVHIPLMKKSSVEISDKKPKELMTGNESILLVDDEEPIARLEKQILERLGYQVTVFNSSTDALSAFQSNPEAFDLIISDMTMPNMTGDQLAVQAMKLRPDIPVIICTGFSERINKVRAKEAGIKGFLMKPIVKTKMSQTVRKVLDASKDNS